jgi:hypothetical protein
MLRNRFAVRTELVEVPARAANLSFNREPSVNAKTTLVPFNDGLALILPQDLVNRLGLRAGDAMEATEMPHGILVTVLAADASSQAEVAREFMDEYRETFADLAKQ